MLITLFELRIEISAQPPTAGERAVEDDSKFGGFCVSQTEASWLEHGVLSTDSLLIPLSPLIVHH